MLAVVVSLEMNFLTGAWEKVDDTADVNSDSSHDFDDEYDPVAEADFIGKAFGDYKQSKKKKKAPKVLATEFEDVYNPDVDVNDPLSGAFGDGFRKSKPERVRINTVFYNRMVY